MFAYWIGVCWTDILLDLTQYEPDYPAMNAIRKVSICPHDDKILVSGGHDFFIKVWDLESDLYRPFYQTIPSFHETIGLVHDVCIHLSNHDIKIIYIYIHICIYINIFV